MQKSYLGILKTTILKNKLIQRFFNTKRMKKQTSILKIRTTYTNLIKMKSRLNALQKYLNLLLTLLISIYSIF